METVWHNCREKLRSQTGGSPPSASGGRHGGGAWGECESRWLPPSGPPPVMLGKLCGRAAPPEFETPADEWSFRPKFDYSDDKTQTISSQSQSLLHFPSITCDSQVLMSSTPPPLHHPYIWGTNESVEDHAGLIQAIIFLSSPVPPLRRRCPSLPTWLCHKRQWFTQRLRLKISPAMMDPVSHFAAETTKRQNSVQLWFSLAQWEMQRAALAVELSSAIFSQAKSSSWITINQSFDQIIMKKKENTTK